MSRKNFGGHRTVAVLVAAMMLLTGMGEGASARAVDAPAPSEPEVSADSPSIAPQTSDVDEGMNPILLPALAGDEGAQLAVNWPGIDGMTVTVIDAKGQVVLEGESLESGVNLFALPDLQTTNEDVRIEVSDPNGRVVESVSASQQMAVDDDSFAWESTFTGPGIQDGVQSMLVWDDGTGSALYVGGPFKVAGETTANLIARWDGKEWSALGGGLTRPGSGQPTVRALTVYEGDLVAAGFFESAGDLTVNNIARWDGEEWSALDAGLTGSVGVESLAVVDGELYAGGRFTSAGEETVNRVARWDGDTWSPLTGAQGTGTDGTVYALIEHEGDLVAGGNFETAGGIPMDGIARWDGSEWSPMGEGLGDWRSYGVLDLIIYQGRLIAGGDFTVSGSTEVNGIAAWDDGSWTSLGSGVGGGAGPRVHDMVEYQGDLVAGGSFPEAGGKTVNYIARWDGSDWHALDGSSGVGASDGVGAVGVYGGKLYAGSNAFIAAGGLIVNHIATWDGTEWAPIGRSTGLNWGVNDMVVYRGELVAVGSFTIAGEERVHGVARWNGVGWAPLAGSLGAGLDGPANALAVYQDDLIVGGSFTGAGNLPVNGIARWDGEEWSALVSDGIRGMGGPVHALEVIDGDLIVGGSFGTAGEITANHIASWDGSDWTSLGNGVDDTVLALADYQGNVIAGGTFDGSGSVMLNNVGQWDGEQWSPLHGASEVGVDSTVQALAIYQDNLMVGGHFDSAGGVTVNGVAAWNGAEWSSLTGSAGTGVSGRVRALGVYGDSLIAGGQLMSEAGGITVNGVARWDGTEWHALSGPDGVGAGRSSGRPMINAFANFDADANGPLPEKLMMAGEFDSTGGAANWNLGTYAPIEPLANVTALPGEVSFGELPVGEESDSRSILVASTGNAAVTVSDIAVPGEQFDFSTGDCPDTPFTLEPGETCTLAIAFSPTEVGEFEDEIALTGDGAASTVALSGTSLPLPPAIGTSADELAVHAAAGSRVTTELTISNTGMDDLEWEIVDRGFEIEGVDAPVVDNPGETKVITHSESMEVAPLTSVACSNPLTGYTRDNQYLRVFELPEFDITGDFIVNEVTFGIQTVAPAQDLTVNLYTLDGELIYDNLTLIASETITVEPQSGTLVTVPIESPIPTDSTLVAEIASTDMADSGWFYPGANSAGETGPSYLATTACEYPEPTPLADVFPGFPDAHTVLALEGRFPVDCSWPEWLEPGTLSGITPGGGSDKVELTIDGTGLDAEQGYSANLCITSNDPDRDLVVVPLDLSVEQPAPDPTVPDTTVPDTTVPDVPDDTVPDDTVPDGSVPDEPEWVEPDPGFRFGDVAAGHLFEYEIHWLAANGITYGCNPPDNTLFCPDDEVTRGQMAAFLVRALDLDAGDGGFEDTVGHVFEDDISALAAHGITYGCNPPDNTLFCPDSNVTRGQMAAFLVRALDLSAGDGGFEDTVGHVFEDDIAALAAHGVTYGCNPPDNTRFCPDDEVIRGQMAAFLYRALGR